MACLRRLNGKDCQQVGLLVVDARIKRQMTGREARLMEERKETQDLKRKLKDACPKLKDKTRLIDDQLYEICSRRLQGLRAVDDKLEGLLMRGGR
jgi:hypothetical protein